jgi:2-dehydro-3-deoxyphosphogluconate aldolase/(4S)-4-hydroxy-2-oxoglutarate aldolase
MSNHKFSWELFYKVPVVGIIRNVSLEDVIQILPCYVQAGLTTIEITMNTPGAEEIIKYALQHYPENLNVGAGTVCTKKDLNSAIDAGAQFIVTPIVRRKIILACVKKGIPVFPGAFTPSEIYKAWSLGASMVKVFPAKTLGADYIKDVKAPLNQVKLMPTGGVDIDNIESFKKAGAEAFGVGSPLFKKNFIKEKDWVGLKEHFRQFVEKVKVKE